MHQSVDARKTCVFSIPVGDEVSSVQSFQPEHGTDNCHLHKDQQVHQPGQAFPAIHPAFSSKRFFDSLLVHFVQVHLFYALDSAAMH